MPSGPSSQTAVPVVQHPAHKRLLAAFEKPALSGLLKYRNSILSSVWRRSVRIPMFVLSVALFVRYELEPFFRLPKKLPAKTGLLLNLA
jgi:hypothetical protein